MIFCSDCRNMKTVEAAMGCVGYHCKSKPIPKHDSLHSWKQREDCTVKNRNNDCAEFIGTRKHPRKIKPRRGKENRDGKRHRGMETTC